MNENETCANFNCHQNSFFIFIEKQLNLSTISPINRYRFVELYYRRSEQAKDKDKGGNSKPARIETTVIFLPDTASIMPNRLEWEDVQLRYKEALQCFIAAKEKPAAAESEDEKEIPIITIPDDGGDEAVATESSAENVDDKNSVKKAVDDEPVPEVAMDEGDEQEAEPLAAAVVVNPDSSINDKALTDNKNQKFISLFPKHSLNLSSLLSLVSLL